jgi:DNA mismatch repair protein MutS2
VRRAQGLVSSSHLDAERFLAQIKETRSQTERAHAEAEETRVESQQLASDLRSRLSGIDREREEILRQAREQAAQELDQVRRELRAVQRRLAVMSTSRADLGEIERTLDDLASSTAPAEPVAIPPVPDAVAPAEIEVGDTVWVADLNTTGEVLGLDGEAAEVQVGSFRVRTRLSSLELRHKERKQPAAEVDEVGIAVPAAPAVSLELHLRGMRVEEALPAVEKYLDDVYRAQAPFARIVHGKGTGALRKAVREFLRGHPLVESFRSGVEGEGDTGVTIVKLVHS